jgi:ribosomal protein S8E
LVKGCIVQIDATPFKQWYEQFYRTTLGRPGKKEDDKKAAEPAKAAEKQAPPKKAPQKGDDKKADQTTAQKGDDKKAKGPKAEATKGRPDAKGKAADTKIAASTPAAPKKPSNHLRRKINARNKTRVLEQTLKDSFNTGRVLAKITSKPGQCGRADGYILEGDELSFYLKKTDKKRHT